MDSDHPGYHDINGQHGSNRQAASVGYAVIDVSYDCGGW